MKDSLLNIKNYFFVLLFFIVGITITSTGILQLLLFMPAVCAFFCYFCKTRSDIFYQFILCLVVSFCFPLGFTIYYILNTFVLGWLLCYLEKTGKNYYRAILCGMFGMILMNVSIIFIFENVFNIDIIATWINKLQNNINLLLDENITGIDDNQKANEKFLIFKNIPVIYVFFLFWYVWLNQYLFTMLLLFAKQNVVKPLGVAFFDIDREFQKFIFWLLLLNLLFLQTFSYVKDNVVDNVVAIASLFFMFLGVSLFAFCIRDMKINIWIRRVIWIFFSTIIILISPGVFVFIGIFESLFNIRKRIISGRIGKS